MTPIQAKQYLDSFINYENNFKAIDPRTFKLQRVHALLRRIHFPQSKINFIHVAGTKGKGSTCVFIASILSAAGYKVGLYTSPHLSDFKERIRILEPFGNQHVSLRGASFATKQSNKLSVKQKDCFASLRCARNDTNTPSHSALDPFAGKITGRDFARALEEISPAIEQVKANSKLGRLSFFEVLTVLAVYYFYRKKVDFIVLETGLGGRLDATNVFESCVCALTPISLEHTQQLGSTIQAIAGEKAAIIKNKHQIAVIAPQLPLAERVIKNRLQECGVQSVWIDKNIRYEPLSGNLTGQTFRLKSLRSEYPRLKTKLLGEHQLLNAAVAIGVSESLSPFGFKISKAAVARGIASARWPGRFEILKQKPLVILDGAHNPASANSLVKTVEQFFLGKKVILIAGISEDKDKKGIARTLNRIAKKIIFTQANHPRAWAFNDEGLKNLFPGKKIVRTTKVPAALKEALNSARKDDIILICGSLFVVGEARECLCTN